jgi:NAD-dependent deacetylase
MTQTAPFSFPPALINALRAAHTITVLTGAGISAESGIPTFRDSQTGLWAKYDPHELATPEAFANNPGLVLDWYRWRYSLVMQSKPNPGHYALATMEQHVSHLTLITQNIDGLHRTAGSHNIIELHGNISQLRCTKDSTVVDHWPQETLPPCTQCGSLLRPNVVWFGESLPVDALKAALDASVHCDVFMSIGTSGVVEPAASLPYEALRSKAVVIEINPTPTPLTVYVPYHFPYPAGMVLPGLVQAAWPG